MATFWRTIPLCVLLVAVTGSQALAVIVFKRNEEQPIRGFLVKENSINIVVNEMLPNGKILEHILPHAAIDEIIPAFSKERLEALRPEAPEEYRSYAEELAARTEDPESQLTAIRLCVIAAYLKPDELGESCLLRMAAAARTPEEERAFRALAFKLDPEHDPDLLKPARVVAAGSSSLNDADREALRRAARMLRNGRMDEARRMFRRPDVQQAMGHYTHILEDSDYQEAIRVEGRLSVSLLRKFVTLELALAASPGAAATDEDDKVAPWSQIVARRETTPVKDLTLVTVTEFDPRACRYIDGQWVLPPASE